MRGIKASCKTANVYEPPKITVLESGHSVGGKATNIKIHHNVGGLPEELGFELIEPLRDLFKDEARLKEMSRNARALARPDAAAHLADMLTDLAATSQPEGW